MIESFSQLQTRSFTLSYSRKIGQKCNVVSKLQDDLAVHTESYSYISIPLCEMSISILEWSGSAK